MKTLILCTIFLFCSCNKEEIEQDVLRIELVSSVLRSDMSYENKKLILIQEDPGFEKYFEDAENYGISLEDSINNLEFTIDDG